jgi:hypothetical protein
MDGKLEELGSDDVQLKEFIQDCIDRLSAEVTMGMRTLQMQAKFLAKHKTYPELARERRAYVEQEASKAAKASCRVF